MKVAIIGGGALGSLLAARLAPVAEVWLLTGWAEQAAAIRREGLLLEEPDGSERRVPLAVLEAPGLLARAIDLAVIAVKSHDTARAARKARVALKAGGLALTLQNGLGNLAVIAEITGPGRAVQGVTSEGATLLGPGRVRHAGHGLTHLARQPGLASPLEPIAERFAAAGFETHLTDNPDSLIWGKLVVNCAINPLTALLRVPNGALLESPEARAIMAAAAREAAAVAAALGVALPYADPAGRAEWVAQTTAQNRSSMLQDVLRGAPTEIAVITGAVVAEGQRLGVATPMNALLAQLLRAMEGSYGQRV